MLTHSLVARCILAHHPRAYGTGMPHPGRGWRLHLPEPFCSGESRLAFTLENLRACDLSKMAPAEDGTGAWSVAWCLRRADPAAARLLAEWWLLEDLRLRARYRGPAAARALNDARAEAIWGQLQLVAVPDPVEATP